MRRKHPIDEGYKGDHMEAIERSAKTTDRLSHGLNQLSMAAGATGGVELAGGGDPKFGIGTIAVGVVVSGINVAQNRLGRNEEQDHFDAERNRLQGK